ncbi:MAG: hypothetical protein Q8O32_00205 [bacterium]|nr:hypothetical protein [bacterium]
MKSDIFFRKNISLMDFYNAFNNQKICYNYLMNSQQKKILSLLLTIFIVIVIFAIVIFIGLSILRKMDYLKALGA